MSKMYKIPVVWQSWGLCEVEANSLEEAMDKARAGSLPRNGAYIDDSIEVDLEGIAAYNNLSEEEVLSIFTRLN